MASSRAQPSPGERAGALPVTDIGVIFDMDGTLVDNTPFHFASWQALLKKHGLGELTSKTYYTRISGVPVMETLKELFGGRYDQAGLKELLREKEEFYRKEYAPHVKPIKGLVDLLAALKKSGIKMAMATSATAADIDFILGKIPIREDFEAIVGSSMVKKPKPDPQIFLKAAEMLHIDPSRCIVFEDSLAGIKAGNAAGMKVVGITTGHKAADLKPVDLVIDDYATLRPDALIALFNKDKHE